MTATICSSVKRPLRIAPSESGASLSRNSWSEIPGPGQLAAADGSNPDIFQIEPTVVSINIIKLATGSVPFDFSSISLSTQTNDGTGGGVVFNFLHQDGTSDSRLISLATGVTGLQTFTFDEQG